MSLDASLVNSYARLEAWNAAHHFVLLVYRTTGSFPPEERFGLSSQLRRAAFSIAANIAEGSAKRGAREFRRYLDIAVGSVAELTYTLQLVHDLEWISDGQFADLELARDRMGRLTWGLYSSLRRASARAE